jgi:NTP pyrophosphatase (non-canonical NTP hydrolase)
MNKEQLKEIHDIADTLGYEEQSMQLIEEMAELTQAINKYRRYGTYETKCNMIEEIADVCIMLAQIEYLVQVDDLVLDCYVDDKIQRTKQRLLKYGKNIERSVN